MSIPATNRSEMTPSYWAKYFWTARRLLEGASSR